jgi:copper chaperone CopZ
MLMAVPGVESVEISIPDQTATLQVRKGADPETLAAAVKKGYSAKVMR